MPQPLKVLIAEDNAVDAELLARALRRAGFEPDWQRVDAEADYCARLHAGLDLVLADYEMPQFGGLRAIELLKESGLEIPLIIVSGTIGEETAVAAMKQGAADYLLKDRLARLGPAIDHAMAKSRLRRERIQADEALQIAHAQLRQLLDHSPAVLYSMKLGDVKIVPAIASENLTGLLGFHPEEILGDDWWMRQIHPEDLHRAVASISETLGQGASRTEYRLQHKDGGFRWVDDARRLVRDAAGAPVELVGVWTDITARKSGEEALRASERRFKALFEQAAVGVGLIDATTGRFAQVNQRFCDIVGYSRPELVDLTYAALTHVEDVPRTLEMTRELITGAKRDFTLEKRYVRKDKSEVWANATFSAMWPPGETPDYFIAVLQDVTARKQLEDQVRQAQKMEAIGTLAGGIAHDFNNILTAIQGYTELARMTLPPKSEEVEHLGLVLQAVVRATDLVRQILTFSRQQPHERHAIQLRPIVIETLKLLRATIPSTIEFAPSLAKNAPMVLADASQVHQIVMNLGTNASHAMKDRPGRLQVRLERCEVDEVYAATQPRLRPGVYARLSIGDTGAGMSRPTMRRIFEPFFTTKPPGEGTGLGLAVVHGIMASHDGLITVYSEPGEGTIFHLYFPAHAGEATVVAADERPVPRGRGERILFVDDEVVLARLGQKALVALGYTVEVATRPATALERVRANPERFSLVLTDLTMPGMNGVALAAQLLEIRPALPIIMMTGFSASLTPERVEAAGIRQLLLKPVSLRSLGVAVHDALAAQR